MSGTMLLLFFFSVLILTMALLSLMNEARIEKGIDFGNKAGLAVTSSIFFGWILAQFSTSDHLLSNASFDFGLWPFALSALSLSLYAVKKDRLNRFWVILAVTCLSVLFLPSQLLFFQGALPFWADRVLMALIWALFTNVYVTMEKVDGLTFCQTSTLSVAFLLLPFVVPQSASATMFMLDFSYYPLFVIAGLIGFACFKRRVPDISLGKTAALPLGYLMGFFLVLMSLEGWIYAFLLMPIYYYFEIIYSRINCFIHRANPEPKKFTFLASYAIRENLSKRGVLPFIFMMMLAFAFIGILYKNNVRMALMLSLLVLFLGFYRLARWNEHNVTYRAMFGNVKGLFQQVNANAKDTFNQISQIKKKK